MSNIKCLWKAFIDFYTFQPKYQTILLIMMIAQGITAGVGLLLIIPLLQVIGVDTGVGSNESISQLVTHVFSLVDITPSLVTILLSYIVVTLIIATLRYQLMVRTVSIQQQYITHLRSRLYQNLLHCKWEFITQNRMSDFFHSLTGQIQTVGVASKLMLTTLSQLVLGLTMLVFSMLVAWHVTLFALFLLIILFSLIAPLTRNVYRSGATQLISYKSLFQQLSEQLSSLKMIKSSVNEAFFAEKLSCVSQQLEEQQTELSRANAKTQWIYMVGAVSMFSLFFYVSIAVLDVPFTLDLLLLLIFARLLPQISNMQKSYQQLVHKIPAFKDVEQLLVVSSSQMECLPLSKKEVLPQFSYQIRLEKISYCHPSKKNAVFNDVSLHIDKYEMISLVGRSGVGKSTLSDLIAGLIEPSSGKIFCDSIQLTNENRLAWRRKVAYVTQESFLFNDTVRENLIWGLDKVVEDDELWAMLEKVGAKELVSQLESQLDSRIGDRGVCLSGGERQRLAIARALISNSELIILDEATSALDYESESEIQNTLKALKGKATVLIITHNHDKVFNVDRRIDLSALVNEKRAMTNALVE